MPEEGDGKTEGWLYIIRSNPFGLRYSSKRYFVLDANSLNCYKSMPEFKEEVPVKSAVIDSCIRVTDNGRETTSKYVLFLFTLYNAMNPHDQLKLAGRSSEDAARWINCITQAALKDCPQNGENMMRCSRSRRLSFRMLRGSQRFDFHSISLKNELSHSKRRSCRKSFDWMVFPSVHVDPMTSDVIAPSTWTIFGCQNGLRLFSEAKVDECHGKWDDCPAIMAVGVVDATSETVFQTLMSLGPSRSEWDFCFLEGSVVEHLDYHTDIIYKKLRGDWMPWGMRRRELLLQRYWRREDDGTYVILYHSVFHPKCRHARGYVRACLKSGGYVISPVNQGKQSVVKHMLEIDWKLWKSYIFSSSTKQLTIQMLGKVAALRELYSAKLGNYQGFDFPSGELPREIGLVQSEIVDVKVESQTTSAQLNGDASIHDPQKAFTWAAAASGSIQITDAADEFFDMPDDSEDGHSDSTWKPDPSMHSQDQWHSKLSPAVVRVKKLHDRAVQRRVYVAQESTSEDGASSTCNYGATLQKDFSCTIPCSWSNSDPSAFLIRGESYLRNNLKVKANGTLMQFVGADWLKSNKREDDLGGRPGSIVQKYAARGGNEIFFIVNIQVPGSTTYNLAFYFVMETPLQNVPHLECFFRGDKSYRDSRFKLIPYISQGSWIVKQSVGKKACLVGQALNLNYFQGSNYLEVAVDVGSSTVARGVVSLVLSYLSNLVIELAFLIQGNTQEELPESLLGACRLNHLDISKTVQINSL